MFYIIAFITSALSAGIIFGGLNFFRKFSTSSMGAGKIEKLAAIDKITEDLKALGEFENSHASSAQFDFMSNQVNEARATIEKQKSTLKDVEDALTKAQKNVEDKEVRQQELKSVKEEDEKKLAELLANYDQISGESIALEQQLALSMKNLDEIINEIPLNEDQKAVLTQLGDALLQAGSRLRDLITEYEVVRERLETLKTQHTDLEDEYTRLVEQQLGT